MSEVAKFGVLLPTRGVILAKTAIPDLSPVFDLATQVEKGPYDSVWIGDSVTAKSRLEVISTLGALAVKTKRLKIGTAVLLAAMRNPVVLAQALASVDVLCSGRLLVGVGVSRNDKMFEDEYTACGVPFNQKAGRLSQVLRIMKMLWAEDEVTYPNKYYTVENISLLPKPVQKPGVPLYVSSNNVDSGLKRVALYGDAWITNIPSLKVFKESQKKMEDFASDAGRDPKDIERCLYLTVHMDRDSQKAQREGAAFLEAYYHKTYEAVSQQLVVKAGGIDEVVDFIKEYQEAGIERFIVRFAAKGSIPASRGVQRARHAPLSRLTGCWSRSLLTYWSAFPLSPQTAADRPGASLPRALLGAFFNPLFFPTLGRSKGQ